MLRMRGQLAAFLRIQPGLDNGRQRSLPRYKLLFSAPEGINVQEWDDH